MDTERDRSWGRGVTGGVLIALGVAFLLMNFGLWHYGSVNRLWPLVFFVIALGQLASPTPRRVGSAAFFVVLGFWFFGCLNNWYGMSYMNSWPLLLVGSGLDMLLSGALTRFANRDRRADGGDSDHA
jgi:hypothetical protein